MNPLRFRLSHAIALTAATVLGAAASPRVVAAQDATHPGTHPPLGAQPPPAPVPVRVGFNLQFGWQDGAAPVDHLAVGIAVPVDVTLTDWLALGARFAYLTGGDANADVNLDGIDDDVTANLKTLFFSAGPRLRWWTTRQDLAGWQLELDGGYAHVLDHMPGSGPFAEVGLRRFVTAGAPTGGEFGLSLHFRQGLGAAREARSLVLGLDFALDLFVPTPRPESPDDDLGWFRYTFGPDMLIGGAFGTQPNVDDAGFAYALGFHFGIPFAAELELRTRAELGWRVSPGSDPNIPRDGLTAYTGLAGLRAHLLGSSGWLWADAYLGYAFTFGTPAAHVRDGAVLDFGIGVRLLGCGMASDSAFAEIGLRTRIGIQDNEALDAIYFAIGGSYGSLGGTRAHPRAFAYNECAPAGATTTTYSESQTTTVTTVEPPHVGIDAGLEVHIPEVHAQVEVEVHPVTIEVPLGLALFGGMVQLRIDVSSLPLAQLREAGFVEVRIVGPAGSVARAEGELRAALGPDGAHVSAWSHATVSGVELKAVFTIWPPGSRPPGR